MKIILTALILIFGFLPVKNKWQSSTQIRSFVVSIPTPAYAEWEKTIT